MNVDSSQLHDFAVRYTAAWCSHDPSQVAALFSPNGSITINGGPPAVGRSSITEVARAFMHAFPNLHVTFDELLFENEHVIYCWTLLGTNAVPDGTGHRVHLNGFEKWTFGADNLIAQSLGHFDENLYQHQLQHGSNS